MKKKFLYLPLLFLFAITSIYAKNGIYLTLDGGYANQSGLPSPATAGASSLENSNSPNAIRAGVGYNHDINRFWGIGVDIGVGQYGDATYNYPDGTDTKVVSSTVEFLGVGMFHLQKTDILLKLGGLRLTPEVTGQNAPAEDTQIRFEAALGAAYNFTPHFAATATYAHVFGGQVNTISDLGLQTPSLNEGLIGLRYTFGS
jgi:hypothetical protein